VFFVSETAQVELKSGRVSAHAALPALASVGIQTDQLQLEDAPRRSGSTSRCRRQLRCCRRRRCTPSRRLFNPLLLSRHSRTLSRAFSRGLLTRAQTCALLRCIASMPEVLLEGPKQRDSPRPRGLHSSTFQLNLRRC
jgi:hypothetical protein